MTKKQIILKRIQKATGKVVNKLIPTNPNYIYAEPHINGRTDKFDLINCNADNCLKTLNYYLKENHTKKTKLFIEVYDESRIPELKEYVKSIGNDMVDVEFLFSCWDRENKLSPAVLKDYIKNNLTRYRCKVWVADTGWAHFFDKNKGQKLISFNYGAPFKKGGIYDKHFDFTHFDYICETSLMCSKIIASEYVGDINSFVDIGFSRNDTIGYSDKQDKVKQWLKDNGCEGKKIIVYVPTYRPEKIDYTNVNVFGFDDKGELDKILEDNNACVIAKVHPIQRQWMSDLPGNVIKFEPSYDFTIYDVFSMTDVLISDYSSISSDFLPAHKPVIYDFSDFDKYEDSRGFSFDPITDVCCGDVAFNWEQMSAALTKGLTQPVVRDELYNLKFRIWHKYDDFSSTERNYQLLLDQVGK